jgi:hypothetical protein
VPVSVVRALTGINDFQVSDSVSGFVFQYGLRFNASLNETLEIFSFAL